MSDHVISFLIFLSSSSLIFMSAHIEDNRFRENNSLRIKDLYFILTVIGALPIIVALLIPVGIFELISYIGNITILRGKNE